MLLCCVLSGIQLHAQTPFGVNGRLKMQGVNITNQNGTPIQLRGMSTHGLQYRGNCYTDASLDVLTKEWGADIVRLSMYAREGGYVCDPAYWTTFVDNLIEKVTARGVYILLDWHMLHPGDPNVDIESAKQFFAHMSAKHAGKGNIIYEICNEPNDSKDQGDKCYKPNEPVETFTTPVTWAMIKQYAETIIPIIRANDPNSLIVVGTPKWCTAPNEAIGNALNFPNVLYTTHVYVADSDQGKTMENTRKAIAAGLPVFVTEWGTQDGWGDGANNFERAQQWLDFMATNKISWCNWNFSDSPLSGAAWKPGTCPNGPWTDANLKESGLWIKSHINDPADSWATTPPPTPNTLVTPVQNGSYTLAAGVPFKFSTSSQVANVLLYTDGTPWVNFAKLKAPYEYTWFPPSVGQHLVHYEYYDASWNFVSAGSVTITATSGVTLNITKPAANATVRGEIHINAFAADGTVGSLDGSGITSVLFELLHGNTVVASRLEGIAPYDWYLQTSTLPSGSYQIRATSTSTPAAGNDVAVVTIPVTITGGTTRVAAAPEAAGAEESSFVNVYPVPTSGVVNLDFTLPASAAATLTILDINGKPVQTLEKQTIKAGAHSYQWDTSAHKPGVYVYQLKAGGRTYTGKVVVTK